MLMASSGLVTLLWVALVVMLQTETGSLRCWARVATLEQLATSDGWKPLVTGRHRLQKATTTSQWRAPSEGANHFSGGTHLLVVQLRQDRCDWLDSCTLPVQVAPCVRWWDASCSWAGCGKTVMKLTPPAGPDKLLDVFTNMRGSRVSVKHPHCNSCLTSCHLGHRCDLAPVLNGHSLHSLCCKAQPSCGAASVAGWGFRQRRHCNSGSARVEYAFFVCVQDSQHCPQFGPNAMAHSF